jgi:arsenate reductase
MMVFGLWALAFAEIEPLDPRFSQDQRPKTKTQRPDHEAMSDKITVYAKPTCTKCREMNRFLQDNGVDFSKVNYYIEPLTEEQLKVLLAKMKMTPRELLRTSEPVYRELGLGKGEFTDDEIVSLMIKHPDLIQRPIVERGKRAVLGRPTENVKALL